MSENIDKGFAEAHKWTLANGQTITSPKGLSDTPGGAGTAGMYTIILGTGLLLTEKKWLVRVMAVVSMTTGLFCIYIAQAEVR